MYQQQIAPQIAFMFLTETTLKKIEKLDKNSWKTGRQMDRATEAIHLNTRIMSKERERFINTESPEIVPTSLMFVVIFFSIKYCLNAF